MWRRQQPILGGTGFDGGYKPSLSFVLPKKRVLGCTKPGLINYNPEATEDDGSCIDEVVPCVCTVADLVDTYVVTDDCHPGDGVSIESDLTGDTCFDVQWNGGSPVSSWIVGMDYLGPGPFFWQLGYDDDGFNKILFKISSDRPGGTDCNPVGVYEGDGCIAYVDYA